MTLRRILYIALLFVLQIIANDYLNLGPYIYVCFLPVMIMIAPVERSSIQSLHSDSDCWSTFSRTAFSD